MKIKPLYIQFESMDDFFLKSKTSIHEAMQSKKKSIDRKDTRIWESVEAYQQFMNDQKYAILATIRKHEPKSVYQLAKILNRAQQNVARDCSLLEAHGFIAFKKSSYGRRANAPILSFDYNAIIVCMTMVSYKIEFEIAA